MLAPPPLSLPLKMNKSVVLIKLMETAKAEKRKESPRSSPAAAPLESSKRDASHRSLFSLLADGCGGI